MYEVGTEQTKEVNGSFEMTIKPSNGVTKFMVRLVRELKDYAKMPLISNSI